MLRKQFIDLQAACAFAEAIVATVREPSNFMPLRQARQWKSSLILRSFARPWDSR